MIWEILQVKPSKEVTFMKVKWVLSFIVILMSFFLIPGLQGQSNMDTLLYENFDQVGVPAGWSGGGQALTTDADGSHSWQAGQPQGGIGSLKFWGFTFDAGNADPTTDHTPGDNEYNKVAGQGLMNSSRDAGVSTYYNDTYEWAQSPAIDLTGNNVFSFSFYRWANFQQDYDSAFVEISTDGSQWTRLDHELFPQDVAWNYQEFDLTIELTGASNLFIRWSSKSDGFIRHAGWNIDDVTVEAAFVTNVTWNGSQSSDWSDPLNWTPHLVPNDQLSPVIPDSAQSPALITSSVTCDSLTIKPGAALTVVEGAQLTISGDLVIESDQTGTGVLVENNNLTVNGETIVQQYVDGNQYHYIGSPVKNTTNDVVNSSVYFWDEYAARNNWLKGWKPFSGVWKGFQGYNINLSSTDVVEFKGELNSGSMLIDLTGTDGDEVLEHEGWNLIANPYVSPLDWDAVNGWDKNNIQDAIYIWDPDLKNYMSYVNGVGTNGGTSFIPPMQGFFVKTQNYGSASIQVNNLARVARTDTRFKSSSSSEIIRLKVSKGDFYDEAVLRFNDFATDSFDYQMDAYKKFSSDNRVPNIYTRSNDVDYSINTIPENDDMVVFEMPFNLQASARGSYEMTLSASYSGAELVIVDVQSGQTYPVENGQQFSFDVNENSPQERFILKSATEDEMITGQEDLSVKNSVSVVALDGRILIKGLQPSVHNKFEIYDYSGRLLRQSQVNKNEYYQNVPGNHMIIVKVSGDQYIRSFKVISR